MTKVTNRMRLTPPARPNPLMTTKMSDKRLMTRIETYDRALWVLKPTDLREQKRVLEERRDALLAEAKARGLIERKGTP